MRPRATRGDKHPLGGNHDGQGQGEKAVLVSRCLDAGISLSYVSLWVPNSSPQNQDQSIRQNLALYTGHCTSQRGLQVVSPVASKALDRLVADCSRRRHGSNAK